MLVELQKTELFQNLLKVNVNNDMELRPRTSWIHVWINFIPHGSKVWGSYIYNTFKLKSSYIQYRQFVNFNNELYTKGSSGVNMIKELWDALHETFDIVGFSNEEINGTVGPKTRFNPPKHGPQSRALCSAMCALLIWPILSLLILFILFSMFCVLIHNYTLCFTGSPWPCCNFSYYNYISIWPYHIVIHYICVSLSCD